MSKATAGTALAAMILDTLPPSFDLSKLRTASQLAKRIPSMRGKATSGSTVYRWMMEGRLKYVIVGDRRMSTEEWLLEMFEREAQQDRERLGIGLHGSTRSKAAGDRAAIREAARHGIAVEQK